MSSDLLISMRYRDDVTGTAIPARIYLKKMFPEGFQPVDVTAPLDVGEFMRATPANATTKGMFFESMLRAGTRPASARANYVAFKDYPLTEWMEVAAAFVEQAYPGRSIRAGLRRVGASAYPTLRESLLGRVLFATVGTNVLSILKLAARAYELSLSVGRGTLVEHSDRTALVSLESLYNFVDCYHVGVFEGVLIACGESGRVGYKPISQSSGELFVAW